MIYRMSHRKRLGSANQKRFADHLIESIAVQLDSRMYSKMLADDFLVQNFDLVEKAVEKLVPTAFQKFEKNLRSQKLGTFSDFHAVLPTTATQTVFYEGNKYRCATFFWWVPKKTLKIEYKMAVNTVCNLFLKEVGKYTQSPRAWIDLLKWVLGDSGDMTLNTIVQLYQKDVARDMGEAIKLKGLSDYLTQSPKDLKELFFGKIPPDGIFDSNRMSLGIQPLQVDPISVGDDIELWLITPINLDFWPY